MYCSLGQYTVLTVYVACFGIGLFPERGIRWISNTANRVLNQKAMKEQRPLSLIDGIGEWQEGRLDQGGTPSPEMWVHIDV